MRNPIVKRSIVIDGRRTSVSLEEEFFVALKDIAWFKRQTLSRLIASIAASRKGNLSSAIRLYVLNYYIDGQTQASSQQRAESEHRVAH